MKTSGKNLSCEFKEEWNTNTNLNVYKGFKALTLVSDPKKRAITLTRVKSVEK